MKTLGGDPTRINPLLPAELVIDHSVQVDEFGRPDALTLNAEIEFARNKERYAFLRWGQTAFRNFAVVPPDTGIVHQVNLEYLARVVFSARIARPGRAQAYPDTLVGTDSHTTMVNGLGVLGWGVGGIEAEAAMLGQPLSMLIPQVVGFRLHGKLREGSTATDLVLTVTEMLRKKGVVGKFVEFFGAGLATLPLADRATIANMAPEYGATCGIFPVDDETLRYLRFTGRSRRPVELVEAYCTEQGLFHGPDTPEAEYTDVLELDLGTVEPSVAGPEAPAGPRQPVAARSRSRTRCQASPSRRPRRRRRRRRRQTRRPTWTPTSATRRASEPNTRRQARLGRDRRDHQLHQHVEPVGDGGGGPAGQEGGREGPQDQALGEDLAGARVEGRHRVPRRGRADAVPRAAEASTRSATAAPPASATRARCRSRSPTPSTTNDLVVGVGAVGQPQLRGPHQPRCARQLPDVAAAGRGLRARRAASTSISTRSRWARARTAQPVFLNDIWPSRERGERRGGEGRQAGDVPARATRVVFEGDERWQQPGRAARADRTPGIRRRPTSSTRPTSRG